MHSASWHAAYSRDIVMCVTFAKIPKRVHGHTNNDISWRNKHAKTPITSKDAAHHACLDRVLTSYACYQRILTFTSDSLKCEYRMYSLWSVRTSRIWWHLMNTRAYERTNGTKRCSTSRLLRSSSNIVCVSAKNCDIYSLECEYMMYSVWTVRNITNMMISHEHASEWNNWWHQMMQHITRA